MRALAACARRVTRRKLRVGISPLRLAARQHEVEGARRDGNATGAGASGAASAVLCGALHRLAVRQRHRRGACKQSHKGVGRAAARGRVQGCAMGRTMNALASATSASRLHSRRTPPEPVRARCACEAPPIWRCCRRQRAPPSRAACCAVARLGARPPRGWSPRVLRVARRCGWPAPRTSPLRLRLRVTPPLPRLHRRRRGPPPPRRPPRACAWCAWRPGASPLLAGAPHLRTTPRNHAPRLTHPRRSDAAWAGVAARDSGEDSTATAKCALRLTPHIRLSEPQRH